MRISDWSSDVCSSDLYRIDHALQRLRLGEGLLESQSAVLLTHATHPCHGPHPGLGAAGDHRATRPWSRCHASVTGVLSPIVCWRNALICGIRARARSASASEPLTSAPISTRSEERRERKEVVRKL